MLDVEGKQTELQGHRAGTWLNCYRVRVQVILEPSFAMPIVRYYELTKLTPLKQMEAGCFQCHNEVIIDSSLHLKVQDSCYFIILET